MEIQVASAKDLAPGTMIGIEKEGKSLLLANIDGKYFAIGNICTHQGCTPSEGQLDGDKVQCPCHDSVFNIKTGEVVEGPARKPEPAYQLKVNGGQIFLLA